MQPVKLALILPAFGCLTLGSAFWMINQRPPSPGRLVAKQDAIEIEAAPPKNGFSQVTAETQFELRNQGGTTVRVVSVASGCGCAVPKVEPTTIAPGAVCRVAVSARIPSAGDKWVGFEVKTDSPVTQTLVLRLHLTNARPAPFLLRFDGDLNYSEEMTSSEPRMVRILTVESAGTPFAYPSVASDLPFLSFRLTGESEARYTKPTTRLRTYEYAVECLSPPSRGTITGSAYVISPWDTSHIAALNVYAPDRRRLRVTPSGIVVEKQRFDPDSTIAQLLVTTSEGEARTRSG